MTFFLALAGPQSKNQLNWGSLSGGLRGWVGPKYPRLMILILIDCVDLGSSTSTSRANTILLPCTTILSRRRPANKRAGSPEVG